MIIQGATSDKICQYVQSPSSLFILSKRDNDASRARCIVRVSTTSTALLYNVRTTEIATASPKNVITYTHKFAILVFKIKSSSFSVV